MSSELDALATELYVGADDLLKESPHLAPESPAVSIAPQLSDAELTTLAVLQSLLGYESEARWIRYSRGRTCAPGDLGGWAQYRYCASRSLFFWGLRLHLACTLHGLPVMFALTGAKADEREALLGMLGDDPALAAARPWQSSSTTRTNSAATSREPSRRPGCGCCGRPARASPREPGRSSSSRCARSSSRSTTRSRASLTWEDTAGTTPQGVTARVLQRLLALTWDKLASSPGRSRCPENLVLGCGWAGA